MAPTGYIYPSLLSCLGCRMLSEDPTVLDVHGICVKCCKLTSLEARIEQLELLCSRSMDLPSPEPRTKRPVPAPAKKPKSNKKPKSPEPYRTVDEWNIDSPPYTSVESPPRPPSVAVTATSAESNKPAWTRETLVIGSSIVRDIELPNATTRCYPGARLGDIEGNLRLLSKSKNQYRQIIIHAGGNDTRRGQSEVVKIQVEAVCALAKSMSEKVVFSGPLPDFANSERFSRAWAFNNWLSRWCPVNGVHFIDNWSYFEGRYGLIRKDGIHPTHEGSALLIQNMRYSLLQE